jgi:RNA polymerase sigma factor (sigma-70 family)
LDTAAFDSRYQELFADLARVCRALGGGHEAEDLAQDALVAGRMRLADLRDDTRLVPWLRRIAVRATLRSRRSRSPASSQEAGAPDPSIGLVEMHADERLAMARLTARQRQFVALVYFVGYRQEEVAEMMEVSRGTVAKTLWEARLTLARALADYDRGGRR